jgi:hypothetical protein
VHEPETISLLSVLASRDLHHLGDIDPRPRRSIARTRGFAAPCEVFQRGLAGPPPAMAWSKSTRIKVMLAIDVAFFLLEIIVGLLVHSLALTADAFHMVGLPQLYLSSNAGY